MVSEERGKPVRYVVSVRTDFGFVGVEGESVDDVVKAMAYLPELMGRAYARYGELSFSRPPPPTPTEKPELEGIMKRSPNGTREILIPVSKLSGKEVIFLMMYDQDPKLLTTSELAELVSQCWKRVDSSYVSVYLTGKAYKNYFVAVQLPEGQTAYRLSGVGREYVRSEIIPKMGRG